MPGRADPAEKKVMGDAEQALVECTALEAELAELKAKYEQFFLGVERMPPAKMHEALRKRVLKLKGLFLRQTAVRFRVQQLAAKLTTYERLWDRTLKEIEAGTYRRDVFKAKLHQQKRAQPSGAVPPQAHAVDDDDFHIDEDLSDLDHTSDELDDHLDAVFAEAAPSPAVRAAPVKPVTPPPVAPAATLPGLPNLPTLPAISPPRPRPVTGSNPVASPAAAGPAGGLSDQKLKAIFDAYVLAKKRCGEDTRTLTFDSVATTLKKQVPELMKQHNARSVEFKVVIKDGKAVLRALPKDS